MNEINQISAFELTALVKILTGVLSLIGSFVVLGVIALFKMNANISKLFTFIKLHDQKHTQAEKEHDKFDVRISALEKR